MPTCLMTVRWLAAALALHGGLAPFARAQPAPAQVAAQTGAPGIAPFTRGASAANLLAWAKRWADENLAEPGERFDMLSYAVSAAEQREVLARPTPGNHNPDGAGGGNRTAFTHLRHVNFLVELRRATVPEELPASAPAWSVRHLCNATLVAPRWVLTAASCVPETAAAAGIEARMGAQDLSQDGGVTRRVIKVERNPAAGLALLELDANATDQGSTAIAPPNAFTPTATTNDQVEFLGLGFGRTTLLDWPKVLYRHFVLLPETRTACPDAGATATGSCLTGSGLRLCAGDNGSPIYVYDLEAGPLLAGVLTLPTGAPGACFEALQPGRDEQSPPAPVIPITRWADWIAAVTGARFMVVVPQHLAGIAGYIVSADTKLHTTARGAL